jgi:hypothetical protein
MFDTVAPVNPVPGSLNGLDCGRKGESRVGPCPMEHGRAMHNGIVRREFCVGELHDQPLLSKERVQYA